MKTAILAAALLLPLAASAQVMVETKAERAERCAAMGPQIEAGERAADARIATEADVIAQTRAGNPSAATMYHAQNRKTISAMRAIGDACRVAAPEVGARADAVADRLNASSLRALDVAAKAPHVTP